MPSKLKLYYSPGACSFASHMALEEAGADYEPIRVNFGASEQRSPEYLRLNPKGRVPVLVDGDNVITENPAILRYIALTHPEANLWPKDPIDDARCSEWLAWICSGVHPTYAHMRRPERYATSEEAKQDVVATGVERSRDAWEAVEKKLADGKGAWAAGDSLSVADLYLTVFWTWGRRPPLSFDMAKQFPVWTDHAKRVAARPSVQKIFAREGADLPA